MKKYILFNPILDEMSRVSFDSDFDALSFGIEREFEVYKFEDGQYIKIYDPYDLVNNNKN